MKSESNRSRLLGAAFLIVVLTSLLSGLIHDSATGTGDISSVLTSIADRTVLLQISVVGWMITAVLIMALAVLLYRVLAPHNRTLAQIALGLWTAEVVFLAVSILGTLALIPLSQDFVLAGQPQGSYYQQLGAFLFDGLEGQGMMMHMWFYCLGGLLWYGLFYRYRLIPRPISLFGLLAVALATLGIMINWFGVPAQMALMLPILPFEIAIGGWLFFKGTTARTEKQAFTQRLPVSGS